MKSILISGITGFVGGNLKKYLKSDFKILGVSRASNFENDMLSYQDIQANEFNRSYAFIHLAGKAHDLKKTSADQEYFEVNTELTKVLFDKFLKSDCEVFIYMSSVKAAADKVEGILTEDVVSNPITAYGKSKLAAENYILSKETSNKRVYILRPCMIHGPNNKGNLNLLYNLVSKGIPYPLGSYANERSFVSIDNLCFIIRNLIENDSIASGIYNIADDETISTNGIIKLIGEIHNNGKVKILNIPKPLIKIVAKTGNFLPIYINEERLDKLTENYVVSNKKIKKVLSISELPRNLKVGLKKTIYSFKD